MLKIDRFYLIGHRGNEIYDPENTLPAFQNAINQGVDFVELDLQESRDSELVVFHDRTLEGKTPLEGKVADFDLLTLLRTPVKGLEGQYSANITSLREVFEKCGTKVNFLLEMKRPQLQRKIIALVKEFHLDSRIIVDSFHFKWIQQIREIAPEIPTLFLVPYRMNLNREKKRKNIVKKLVENGFLGLSLHSSIVSGDLVNYFLDNHLVVLAWGVKQHSDYARVIQAGVNGFTAPDPKFAREVAEQLLTQDAGGFWRYQA